MNKKQDCTFWLSIASITISVIAVCVTLIRSEPFTVDGVSLLVGILSAAVAIYVFLHAINELFVASRVRKSIEGKMSGHVEGSKAFSRYRNIEDETLKSVIDLIG